MRKNNAQNGLTQALHHASIIGKQPLKDETMKSTLLLITTLLSITAFSETATLTVDGMHCGGCKKMVTKAVCNDSKISESLSECSVSVNEETQKGTVILKSKESKTINIAAVEAAITSAGEDYKVSKKDIKK